MSEIRLRGQPRNNSEGVYHVHQNGPVDAVDVFTLLSELWYRKWMVLGIAVAFGALAAVYSLLAAPIYRAEAVIAPSNSEVPSGLPSSLTGLAGLAGVNVGRSRDVAQSIATLRSRVFVEEFIQERDLLPVLFRDQWDAENARWTSADPDERPDIRDGVKYFVDEIRFVKEENDTGLVTLAIEWHDPEVAAEWVAELIDRINTRLRAKDLEDSKRRLAYLHRQLETEGLVELRQAISRLIESQIETIMLAQAEEEYAFRVIDQPRVPKEPTHPKRAMIVLLALFFGMVAGSFVAFVRWAYSNRFGIGEVENGS